MTISSVPPLPASVAMVDPKTGFPSSAFMRYFNDTVAATVNALTSGANAQAAANAAAAAAVAADVAALAASTAAAAANTAAIMAGDAADAVTASSALANSYATGLTITATDAGANVTITISAHDRVYFGGATVAVSGGSVTGLAYSTDYWLAYDQASRAGGAVTYLALTTMQGNGTAPNRHFVGAVATPAAAGPPAPGNPVLPPGTSQP